VKNELDIHDQRPLYRQIEAKIESSIRHSIYSPGEMIPSDRQLCDKYKVSYLTARQAVGELVKRGLLTRRQGKGTFVTEQSGVKTTSNIAMLCTSGVSAFQDYYAVIMEGIEQVCVDVAYSVQVFMTAGDSIWEPRNQLLRELITNGKIHGLVLLDPLPEQDLKTLISGSAIPVVSIVPYKKVECPFITVDHKRSGFTLTRHLMGLGHERIGIVVKPLDNGSSAIIRASNLFLEGYYDALASEGIKVDQKLVKECLNTLDSASGPMVELLSMTPRPTAIIGGAQRMVEAAAIEAQKRGYAIPKDVSIAGVVEADFNEFYTGLVMPTKESGMKAARMLIRLMNGEALKAEASRRLPCVFRKGKSTARPSSH
jgi:GntR family transcriptional regulator, arabinose operon transcriptional repressor